METASSPIDDSLNKQSDGELNSNGNVNEEDIGGAVQSEKEEAAKEILPEDECKDQNRVHGEDQCEKDGNVNKDHDQSEENSFEGQDGNEELENNPEEEMNLKEEDVEEVGIEEEEFEKYKEGHACSDVILHQPIGVNGFLCLGIRRTSSTTLQATSLRQRRTICQNHFFLLFLWNVLCDG